MCERALDEGEQMNKRLLASLAAAGCLVLGAFLGFGGKQNTDTCSNAAQKTDTAVENLRVEYRRNPLGTDEEEPVFSWQMESERKGQKQTGYRIFVSDSRENLEKGIYCWDSGKNDSDRSVSIPYQGEKLKAATRYFWKVVVWDCDGNQIISEEDAWFETGLMDSGWSNAKWIGAPDAAVGAWSEEACRYTIEYDFTGGEGYAGFAFGGDTDRYGEYYLWTVYKKNAAVWLQTCRVDRYCFVDEQEILLEEYCGTEMFESGLIHMCLEVNGNIVRTSLNGHVVAETMLAGAKPLGRIGLYNHRTTEVSRFDNILIRDENGRVLLEEDFENKKDTVFSPEYISIQDGMGCARAGITMTPGNDGPAPMLRRKFETKPGDIVSARLYGAALGIFRIFVNGEEVSDHYFDPGHSVYDEEIQYCTYDVTELIQNGANAVGVYLGHGWFDRAAGGINGWYPWGECDPAFLGKLVICYADGSRETFVTDESWKVYTDGPIRRDDMYQGEYYDANREVDGWCNAGFADAQWETAAINQVDEKFLSVPLTANEAESVENVMTLAPVAVTEPEEGTYVYDFGQEFTGVCRITVRGKAGQCLTMRYGEALNTEQLRNRDDEVGTVWTQNQLSAANTDYYVLKGADTESYSPSMVCRGFRYMQISGVEAGTELVSVEGLVLMGGLEETGSFESSDIWFNRIYHNIFWAQRSNFLATPTDCPQRDERFGWTGDICFFSPTAVYNMNARNFLGRFLRGMRLEQDGNGAYPDMVPHNDGQGFGHYGWGDAGVVVTWELYQQYGDISCIEDNFEAMCSWVDYLEKTSSGYLCVREEGYGDHLQYQGTPAVLTNTAQAAKSALLLSKMAGTLGEKEAQAHYGEVYEKFRKARQDEFLREDGIIEEGSQTAYAMALSLGLYPEELKNKGREMLAACVQWAEVHPMTGYVGTPYLLPALADAGYTELAYQLLEQKTAPSWGRDIALGATTTAESWDSYVTYEDGTYGLYGSLNHYALGAIGEWFYSGILGIQPDEDRPGFQHIVLRPQIYSGISFAKGSYESVYGTIESGWENAEDGCRYQVSIPANTTAILTLPVTGVTCWTESGKELAAAEGLTIKEQTEENWILELESGRYDFWGK